MWLVDLQGRRVHVSQLVAGRWRDLAVHSARERSARIAPFAAIEIDLEAWWRDFG